MIVKGNYSEEDFIDFQKLSMSMTTQTLIIINILSSCSVVLEMYLLLFCVREIFGVILLLFMLITSLGILFIFIYYLPRNWKIVYEQSRQLRLPFELTINDNELILTNELTTNRNPWKDFIKWKENTKTILLYVNNSQGLVLPKRLFSATEIEYIHEQIMKNNLPNGNKSDRKRRWIVLAITTIIALAIILFILFTFQ